MVVLGSDSGESVQLQVSQNCADRVPSLQATMSFSQDSLGGLLWLKKNVEWKKGNQKESRMRVRNTSDVRHWFCLHYRDGSASSTYYFKDQSAVEIGSKSWLYLRTLKRGEEEFPIRNEQVRCRKRRGGVLTKKQAKWWHLFISLFYIGQTVSLGLLTSHSQKICQKILWVIKFS